MLFLVAGTVKKKKKNSYFSACGDWGGDGALSPRALHCAGTGAFPALVLVLVFRSSNLLSERVARLAVLEQHPLEQLERNRLVALKQLTGCFN